MIEKKKEIRPISIIYKPTEQDKHLSQKLASFIKRYTDWRDSKSLTGNKPLRRIK